MQQPKRQLPVPFHLLGEEIRLYWVFRIYQGLAVFAAFMTGGEGLYWTPANPELGQVASALFVSAGLAMFGISFLRRMRADWQFYAGATLDIVYVNFVLAAAPGAMGMVMLMLITSIAASALFIHLRFGLLMALLGILTLVAHRFFFAPGPVGDGPAVNTLSIFALGYISMALLFIALILGRIGTKLFSTERIASERKEEILELSALNEQMLKRLPMGVLVVDDAGDIRSSNEAAMQLLQLPLAPGRRSLLVAQPELRRQLEAWERDPTTARAPIAMGPEARQIEPQFLHLYPGSDEVLVFLEDTSQAARRAESITLATLGRFSASLAHEIRNPLSAIKYSSQLLGESANLDVMDRRMLDIVQQQIQRMNGIIDSVLGLARREPAHPQVFDLSQMLRDFITEYVAGFPLDNDVLDLQAPLAAQTALADPKHIHQIVMVLVSNARYYGRMPQEPAKMTLRLHTQGTQFAIDVLDEGPGIPEQARKNLFHPFFTTSSHGTGLGLYIARELARANQGDLQYMRRANGSCFRLTLPKADAHPAR